MTGVQSASTATFPFLFGRAFIEAAADAQLWVLVCKHFPSFLERLSLRLDAVLALLQRLEFLCFFVGTFIEAPKCCRYARRGAISPPFRRDFH